MFLVILTTGLIELYGRAFYRAKGTEYAAVTGIGFEQDMTVCAFVEVLTGISGHAFFFAKTTMGTGQDGVENQFL